MEPLAETLWFNPDISGIIVNTCIFCFLLVLCFSLKYLEIYLVKSPTMNLLHLNFDDLIGELLSISQGLNSTKMSWAGCIASLKCPYYHTPFICSTPSLFQSYIHICVNYSPFWTLSCNNKHPQVHSSLPCTPMSKGGMGAPNVSAYYKAVIFKQAKAWWKPASAPAWFWIELITLQSESKTIIYALLLAPKILILFIGPVITLYDWIPLFWLILAWLVDCTHHICGRPVYRIETELLPKPEKCPRFGLSQKMFLNISTRGMLLTICPGQIIS